MSKRSHRKQVERAKAKRRASAADRRQVRNRIIILVMAALMVLSLVGGALVGLLGGADAGQPAIDDAEEDEPGGVAATAEPCPEPDDAPEVDSEIYDEPPLAELDAGADYRATIRTTCGDITLDLDTDGAPIATANLVGLAEDGYYDGVLVHRVVNEFVIQAGDPAGTGCGQDDCTAEGFDPDAPTYPGYTFEDELDVAEALYEDVRDQLIADFGDLEDLDPDMVPGGYPRGTVAMANAGPDTNGSQFFVAQGDPTTLPTGPAFTVLGHVVDGMDVVDRIAGQEVDGQARPVVDVRIITISIEAR